MKKEKRAIVLGLGASGQAAARLLSRNGAEVRVLEQTAGSKIEARKSALLSEGIQALTGISDLLEEHVLFDGTRADICIVSPGVPADSEWLKFIDELRIPTRPEIDLGAEYAKVPMIAVTGSNGKSTLVKLLVESLANAGVEAEPCGNYGLPLCAAVEKEDVDRFAVEVSTFQMELSRAFTPQSAVLLNIQPNHLDRHPDMDTYASLKVKLFASMPKGSVAVVKRDCLGLVEAVNSEIEPVTIGESGDADYWYEEGSIHGKKGAIDVKGTLFDNPVMGLTGAAALAVLVENGWECGAVEEAARRFVPLHFRMEELEEQDGVRFVNNSKATTLAAIEASLKILDGPVRLIAGGVLKEENLEWIKKMLVKKVVKAYLYGQAGGRLSGVWSGYIDCADFADLSHAVRAAWSDAESGNVILLSPGCASFDQYSGYVERGQDFNRIVKELRR